MFPLGHLGIPIGVQEVARRFGVAAPFPALWLAFGSILPDLVDKPIGHLILDLGNGRIVAHTLLFLLVLVAASLLARSVRPSLFLPSLALALGAGSHLVLDSLWNDSRTLLWPLLGSDFPALGISPERWLDRLLHDPWTQAGEASGAMGIGLVLWTRWTGRMGSSTPAQP